jgi:hypothetical protein
MATFHGFVVIPKIAVNRKKKGWRKKQHEQMNGEYLVACTLLRFAND